MVLSTFQIRAVLAVKDNLQSEVSRIECIQNEVSKVKHEALRWLAAKNAELTQLKGSADEMAKLKEDIETLLFLCALALYITLYITHLLHVWSCHLCTLSRSS